MAKYTIITMPGDGIGNQVLPESLRVLKAVGLDAEYIHADIGWDCWRNNGNALPERTIDTTSPYRLTSQSDRMGYRLEGSKLAHAGAGQWISDGTAMGALQVPPDEQPILLMADRQTTGGYPKIAVVISADLHLAGQLMPGDTVAFRTTTLPEAQAAMKAQCKELDEALPPYRTPSV